MLRRLRRGAAPAQGATVDPPLVSDEDRAIIARARPFTMTSDERLQALIDSVRYCEKRGVQGAFAECGVWRGGSVLAMILTLQELGVDHRDIHLFDTFEGMTAPTEHDVSPIDPPALGTWQDAQASGERAWSELFNAQVFDEAGVREVLTATGYPAERLHFVRGPVEETLPKAAPERLALLRLDTDWYESTRHELEHLWPRLSDGGVLIVDDYGHWEGARRAVDEYFETSASPVLLSRIDYTGRLAVKH
jgi:hypothetical protein